MSNVDKKESQTMKTTNSERLVELAAQSEPDSRSTRFFFRIASFATALALGCAAASMQSLHWNASKLSFQISLGTFVAFAVGAGVALIFWKTATSSVSSARKGSLWLALIGVAVFLYPLRFVPPEKLPDIAIGLTLAVAALSTIAWMIWQVGRFLDRDAQFETPTPPSSKVAGH